MYENSISFHAFFTSLIRESLLCWRLAPACIFIGSTSQSSSFSNNMWTNGASVSWRYCREGFNQRRKGYAQYGGSLLKRECVVTMHVNNHQLPIVTCYSMVTSNGHPKVHLLVQWVMVTSYHTHCYAIWVFMRLLLIVILCINVQFKVIIERVFMLYSDPQCTAHAQTLNQEAKWVLQFLPPSSCKCPQPLLQRCCLWRWDFHSLKNTKLRSMNCSHHGNAK